MIFENNLFIYFLDPQPGRPFQTKKTQTQNSHAWAPLKVVSDEKEEG
jgi:hypothetical protein